MKPVVRISPQTPARVVWDALILGAGPAGSVCAARLAERGWSVAAVDRAVPGRSRVCGGFLGPEFAEWMRRWGWGTAFEALPKHPVEQLLVTGRGESRAMQPIGRPEMAASGAAGRGYAVDRGIFDAWLMDLALSRGAEVLTSTEVLGLKRIDGIWRGELSGSPREVQARTLIVAHGRRAASGPAVRQTFFACRTVYRNLAESEGTVALHFVPRGHVGLNPLGAGEATMCLCVDGSYLRASRGNLDAMMTHLMDINPHLKKHLAGAVRSADWSTCQAQPDGKKVFFKEGRFFAGDAVSMVNPVIGGGIPIAMHSAVLLADALADARESSAGEAAAARAYERAWKKAFAGKFVFGDWLGAVERSDRASRAVLAVLDRVPGLLSGLVRWSRPSPV